MNNLAKVILLEFWFFFVYPLIGWALMAALGFAGLFLYSFVFILWCWGLFAFWHYRHCRQEEFLHVLRTATATQAPVEVVLEAYLEDRPQEPFSRALLLSFVFPGYHLFHRGRSFDDRLKRLAQLLDNGVPLEHALRLVPGVVSRDTALAVTVGQFSGRPAQALERLPDQRLAAQWLELLPRLFYPLLLLGVLVSIISFLTIFIIPKYEKIFADFHLKLPTITQDMLHTTGWLIYYSWLTPVAWLLALALINCMVFSSHVKWYFPVLSWIYRLHARGQFLRTLGLMLDTGKPLPSILGYVAESGLLPAAVQMRVEQLTEDLEDGKPLAESLVRRGLATASQQGLIASAEKARNLPWALEELGDTLARRSAKLTYRLTMVLFPLSIFACACLVAFVAVGMFMPLVALIEGVHG